MLLVLFSHAVPPKGYSRSAGFGANEPSSLGTNWWGRVNGVLTGGHGKGRETKRAGVGQGRRDIGLALVLGVFVFNLVRHGWR